MDLLGFRSTNHRHGCSSWRFYHRKCRATREPAPPPPNLIRGWKTKHFTFFKLASSPIGSHYLTDLFCLLVFAVLKRHEIPFPSNKLRHAQWKTFRLRAACKNMKPSRTEWLKVGTVAVSRQHGTHQTMKRIVRLKSDMLLRPRAAAFQHHGQQQSFTLAECFISFLHLITLISIQIIIYWAI